MKHLFHLAAFLHELLAQDTSAFRSYVSCSDDIQANRAREIMELAEAVADEHCPSGKIDPELIIWRKNIRLIYDHYADAFDGMVEHEAGRFYIHCNLDRETGAGSPRGRFTLAHELGHNFIDEHRNGLASRRVRATSLFRRESPLVKVGSHAAVRGRRHRAKIRRIVKATETEAAGPKRESSESFRPIISGSRFITHSAATGFIANLSVVAPMKKTRAAPCLVGSLSGTRKPFANDS